MDRDSGLGALEAPLNHAYKGDWLRRVLSTIGPKVIVVDERFCDVWETLLSRADRSHHHRGRCGREGYLSVPDLLAESIETVAMIDGGVGDPHA